MLYSLGSRATYVPGGRTVYADSPGDALLVTALTRVLCAALGCAPPTPASAYAGFVAVAFVLARGRTAAQQHAFVQATLEATATPGVLGVVRWLVRGLTALRFPVNLAMAAGTVPFAGWLVGPASVADGSLGAAWAAPGAPATVVLRRCRFLEASSCRSACFNVCKVPTQAFFEQSVGVALTMRPDYETLECRMTFGELAPAPQDDEAAHGPCFTACTAAAARAADALGCETAAAREAVRR